MTSKDRADLHSKPRSLRNNIKRLQQQDLNEEKVFWQELLQGFTSPTPLDIGGFQQSQAMGFDSHEILLSSELTSALQLLIQRHHLTLNSLIQGAWALLLSRYSREEDVIFGVTQSYRYVETNDVGTEITDQLLVNTLPMRVIIQAETTVLDFLNKLHSLTLTIQNHEHIPLEMILEWNDISPDGLLFESNLVIEDALFDAGQANQQKNLLQQEQRALDQTKYPLTLMVYYDEKHLLLRLEYAYPRFADEAISRMLGHLESFLAGFAYYPIQSLSSLSILTKTEENKILNEWNDTEVNYPDDLCIHHLFEAQVNRTPSNVAVVFEGKQLTYQELNNRANQVAHHLQKLGVKPDVLVGICVERSLEMIVGMLGILKAGGTYVPLDPDYPQERLAFMIEDAHVFVLLTLARLQNTLPEHKATVICLDTDPKLLKQESSTRLVSQVTPQNVAYVTYTSGSTGHPKGVMVPHQAVVHRLLWMQDTYQLTYQDRVLQKAAFSFDVAVWEFLWPLSVGGQSIIAKPGGPKDNAYLIKLISEQQITMAHFVPSMLELFLETKGIERCHSLRFVLSGGEYLSAHLKDRFLARLKADLHNQYGQTETCIDVLYWTCSRDQQENTVPLGRPYGNTQIYILDTYLQPVPIGIAGELYVGGAGLARGYLRRPDLTADRFIPNPFGKAGKTRLYKTGDLARYRPDGTVEFLGRIDYQVKIRGFRIELGEIEAGIEQHHAIREAVVVARQDTLNEKRLVAYLIPNQKPAPNTTELRRFLKEKLPEHMIPSVFIVLETFPLTPNGKLNRKALPAPVGIRPQLETPYVPPNTALESLLTNLWQDVLHIENIGIHDDFFELGGDSIKGAILTNKIQEYLQEIVHVVVLFDAPTIAELTNYLHQQYPKAIAEILDIEGPNEIAHVLTGNKIDTTKAAHFRQLILPLNWPDRRKPTVSKNPPAIFIFSPPRSGSTLLRVILAGHSHLFAPPALELLSFNTLADRKENLSGRNSLFLEGTLRAIMQIKGCSVKQAQQIMKVYEDQNLFTSQFYRLMQEWIKEKTLVDKSTTYALDLETLKRAEMYFEKPRYIHLLRHPYGMINSFEKARLEQVIFRYNHTFTRRELAELIWLISHQNIIEFLKQIPLERQYAIIFEDLVEHPQNTVKDICQFLDLSFEPDMLQPYKEQRTRMTDGLHQESTMIGDPRFHEHRAIEASIANQWEKDITGDFLGDITWQLANLLGYERPPLKQETSHIDSISRINRKNPEQLLAQLDQLSDEEVASLLNEKLTQQKESSA